MKTKFTKGEWETNKDYVWSKSTFICKIEEVNYNDKDIEAIANAQLISAAPDLFEALINIENDDNRIPATIWEMRNKALNKALGEEIFKTKAE